MELDTSTAVPTSVFTFLLFYDRNLLLPPLSDCQPTHGRPTETYRPTRATPPPTWSSRRARCVSGTSRWCPRGPCTTTTWIRSEWSAQAGEAYRSSRDIIWHGLLVKWAKMRQEEYSRTVIETWTHHNGLEAWQEYRWHGHTTTV